MPIGQKNHRMSKYTQFEVRLCGNRKNGIHKEIITSDFRLQELDREQDKEWHTAPLKIRFDTEEIDGEGWTKSSIG